MKSYRISIFLLVTMLALLIYQCKGPEKKEESKSTTTETEKNTRPKKEKPTLVHDDRGNVIERHSYSYKKTDGSIRSRDSYYYTYDDSNNVIHEVKESYNLDGSRKYKNVNCYQYDSRNLKIDLVFESYDENDVMLRTAHHSYKYNERGDKIEDVGYSADGREISRIILNPDDTGLLLSEEYIYYDENGEITSHKKHYYTAYGLERSEDLLKDK